MTDFVSLRKVSFDTETTGPNPNEDRIVTAALIARGAGRPDKVMTWLINPGIPIPKEASDVHGITDEQAAEGALPKDALDDIADRLAAALRHGMPVVAFNLSFDWTILARDLERNGLLPMADRLPGATSLPLIDPHVIDRQVDKYVKGTGMRKLKPTAERYGVELADWHTAEADALAALLIAEAQFARYPQLQTYGPQQLFAAQRAWRAEQQAGLQQWFRTAGHPGAGRRPEQGHRRLVAAHPAPAERSLVMRISRRQYIELYARALAERNQARQERADARSVCRDQADQMESLRDQLTVAKRRPGAGALAAVEGPSLFQRLSLSERARRSLAEQLAAVQASNEAMCREARSSVEVTA
ncbi:exonuclease domain-containing protein [Streptomyces sp. NPDC096153]|uniref:exonuclease domain-containing protein n=1 Tax=Streptomyces sp. NPDC096153 TaxID=3155548 RepID=UPI00331DC6CD